jgi:integrase
VVATELVATELVATVTKQRQDNSGSTESIDLRRAGVSRGRAAALSDAVEQGKLAVNPAIQAKRRRRGTSAAQAKRRKWSAWTEEELNAFLDHIRGDRLESLWRAYAMTGARRGETVALHWSDVSDGSFRIERAYVYAGSRARLEGTKTGRERTVDLDETTAASVEAWRKAQTRSANERYRVSFSRLSGSTPR